MNAKCLKDSYRWIIGINASILVDELYSLSLLNDIDFGKSEEDTGNFNYYRLGEIKRQYDKVIDIFLREDLHVIYKKSISFFADCDKNKIINKKILSLLSNKKCLQDKDFFFDLIIKQMLKKNKGLNYVRTWSKK